MRRTIVGVLALCVGAWSATLSADTLTLRDGRRFPGDTVSVRSGTVTFHHEDGTTRRYPVSDVDTLSFSRDDRGVRAGPPDRPEIDLAAGTELVVRTVGVVDSSRATPDQTFAAIVEERVTDRRGRVVVPEGASARLVIREMSAGGATGSPEMALDVQSVTVDGVAHSVSTIDLSMSNDTGIGSNSRTAKVVGGGAVLGTVIGAVVGGGKGAAIGGLIGAAGGVGAQVITRGREVRVPAETVLRFRLDEAVRLRAERSR